ncbi:hypothetical protein CC80DRAFT_90817 [Byssothecium circinans]|uniref:Uncharacterized protein n=1 Tax=Byssothecium circinans TaxID=147558 RepID=A0A6A5TRE1_9PLEO|nr:hypothetical protein CC80DRAFT_90817 [Byssothecium circinans]
MAAYNSYAPSPRVGAIAQVTPTHSPHHSVNSSTSSRTPLQQLTLHEYRKQQYSPVPSIATPPGKTLRRKAAAPALNEIERAATPRPPLSTSRPPPRPLHISQSAHQLAYQPFPPSPPLFGGHHATTGHTLRSQSAEQYSQGGPVARDLSLETIGRVSNFKPIKRLPKPIPSPLAVTPPPPPPRFSTRRTTLEISIPSDTQTTPSSFSLSRFPQPPRQSDPLSPPNDENAPPRVATASFTTAAPVTPPATPAVIHYRGTSFDLVNPRDSLQFHDIVTPSRDFDSTDFLPLQSSDDLLSSAEMAPRRPLYGDLSAAYTSIIARRNEDADARAASASALDLPLPPVPAAQFRGTPTSSPYSSPLHSPGSLLEVSPLAVKKATHDSRFSLKQLTKSLTKRLSTKSTQDTAQEEELRDLSGSKVSLGSPSFEGEFPRPLAQSYLPGNTRSATYYDDPPSPVSPLQPGTAIRHQRDSDVSALQTPFGSQRYSSAPLASVIPDETATGNSCMYEWRAAYNPPQYNSAPLSSEIPEESSSEAEQEHQQRASMIEGDPLARPYYDDIASIYSGSSIYTSDTRPHSAYPRSIVSDRKSNHFARMSGGMDAIANEYKSGIMYSYPDSRCTSRRVSKPLEQEMFHRSLQQDNKTDTISKFIDQYKRGDSSNTSQPVLHEQRESGSGFPLSASGNVSDKPEGSRVTSGISQLEFGLPSTSENAQNPESTVPSIEAVRGRRPTKTYGIGLPPSSPPPQLASAFEYDEIFDSPPRPIRPGASEALSGVTSYGDTRQLLQLSQPVVGGYTPGQTLEPSSSYSQPEGVVSPPLSPHTPQEALDQADEIFDVMASRGRLQQDSIPAMWSRRGSGNLLLNKTRPADSVLEEQSEDDAQNAEEEGGSDAGDWETVGNTEKHRDRHVSLGGSIANYSSTDDSDHSSRDSMGFSRDLSQIQYQHPASMRSCQHPFTTSPSHVAMRTNSAPYKGLRSPPSSPPFSPTAPAFVNHPDPRVNNDGPHQDPTSLAPWVDVHAMSDKTTQELLASGPNDEIIYHDDADDKDTSFASSPGPSQPSHFNRADRYVTHHGNSFDKFTVVGSRGNVTGTPNGTGMREVGSSEADNSSPGISTSSPYDTRRMSTQSPGRIRGVRARNSLLSSASRRSSLTPQSPGFYAAPGRKTSIHMVSPGTVGSNPFAEMPHEKSPSQDTLFPHVVSESSSEDTNRRANWYSLRRARRNSRAAVPGQTKLRQMVLAPDAQTVASNSTHASRHAKTVGSGRPSTANTHTPLRPMASARSEPTVSTLTAYQHSPHLLCPERASDPVEEEERRKLSWVIFALFCIVPPMIILYRWYCDAIIANWTEGRLVHVSPKPKRIALVAGIAVNVGISGAILIPILVARAVGAL